MENWGVPETGSSTSDHSEELAVRLLRYMWLQGGRGRWHGRTRGRRWKTGECRKRVRQQAIIRKSWLCDFFGTCGCRAAEGHGTGGLGDVDGKLGSAGNGFVNKRSFGRAGCATSSVHVAAGRQRAMAREDSGT